MTKLALPLLCNVTLWLSDLSQVTVPAAVNISASFNVLDYVDIAA